MNNLKNIIEEAARAAAAAKERNKIKCKAYYLKNREKYILYAKKYREEHKNERILLRRNYYLKNKHKIMEQNKIHSKTPKGKIMRNSCSRNCRDRRRGAIGVITNKQWQDKIKKYNYRCVYCGVVCQPTMDHVIPLIKGGTNTIDNVVPVCAECNCRKGVNLWKPKINLKRL